MTAHAINSAFLDRALRRIIAIINPISGGGGGDRASGRFLELGRLSGTSVEVCLTERSGHAREIAARAAGEGFDVVACCGGDGTINEVICGLGPYGLPLLVVPAGTGNALATEIGAPRDPRRYAVALRERRYRTRDLGRLDSGRLFACMVGAGFDAECVRVYKELRRPRTHAYRYLWVMGGVMFRAIAASDLTTLRLTVDDAEVERCASFVLATITPVFGGPIRFMPHAVPDDGRFDILMMTDRVSLYTVLRMLTLGILRRPRWTPHATLAAGARFRLVADEPDGRPVPYQVDGDFAGYLPIAAETLPGALRLVATR